MIIRKIQYNINYSHILSFKDDYKKITAPYFGMDNVKYSVEQQNSIHEALRLIFINFSTVMHFRKDGMTIMFEGDEGEFLSDGSLIKEFFVMYENITKLDCYCKTTKQDLIIYAVDTATKVKGEDYLTKIPMTDKLTDFACVYHYIHNGADINFMIGDFIPHDIEKFDLSPFKKESNSDLFEAEFGKICEVKLTKHDSDASISKLKKYVKEIKQQIKLFI